MQVKRASLLCCLSLLLVPCRASAQVNSGEDVPRVTHTYALENARVVQAPGRVLERATVVIRDGLIMAVGPDAVVPFDAERIAADSFTVYAGFIDGLSHAGVPEPKGDPNRERPDNPGDPPNAEAGIQPDRDVRTLLDPAQKSLADLRKAGYTAAHVVPRGRSLPGSGAIILLAGDNANELVFRGNASLFAQFKTARRMYPGTDMAILAKVRQLYREAQRRQRMETLYADNPSGLERPDYDPVHYAFFPVLSGETPVFFHTEDALDVHRALSVQEELGFPIVLTGLAQSFDALDKLKSAGHPLLLTLDLPDPPRNRGDVAEDSTDAQPTDAPISLPEVPDDPYDATFRALSSQDVDAEKKNLEARRDMEREKYLGNAGALHTAGFSFGFTTVDTKPADILANVRTMIESGLPEDAALAALTTHTAAILGITVSMGTVDAGKLGNLVVTDGSIFDEDSSIRYVFVDGRKFEIEEEKQSASSSETINPAGVWSFEVAGPDGDIGGTITLEGGPRDLTGTISNHLNGEVSELQDLSLEGNALSFSFEADDIGAITAAIIITGDEFEGEVTMPEFGAMPITGHRTSGPGR